MRSSIVLLLFLSSLLPEAQGQSLQPGGVGQPHHWWLMHGSDGQQLQWQNHASDITHTFIANEYTRAWTNGWPVPRLPFASLPQQLSLPATAWQSATIFTVFQAQDPTQEQALWSWQTAAEIPLILTNYRLADLEKRSYLNFSPAEKGTQLSTYVQQNRRKADKDELQLILGQNPEQLDLPIDHWHGLLAELIVYDRLLSPKERRQVESYLALKYGLTLRGLQGGVDYVSSQGHTIWSFAQHPDFHHRVAGIGRDEHSGWQQRQSTSTEQPDDLVIALERLTENNLSPFPPAINDHSFWVWGDNNEPLQWMSPIQQIGPPRLQRQWLMEIHTTTQSQSSELRLEVGRWAPDRHSSEQYWLAIDRSGTGDFSPRQTDYYPMDRISEGRFAHFSEINWDTDGSGTDRFTWLKAPAFSVVADLEQARCKPATSGQISGQLLGGLPPFQFSLTATHTGEKRSGSWEDRSFAIPELSEGNYQLVVQDAQGQVFSQSFYLNAVDAPMVEMAADYQLPLTSQLSLHPSPLTPAENWLWQWQGPENFRSSSDRVNLSIPGTYLLEIEEDGCRNQYTFTLTEAPNINPLNAQVFPNPVAKGTPFRWQVYSQTNFPIHYSLSDGEGTILQQQRLDQDRYFSSTEQLSEPGIYWLTFQMNEHIQTLKLIVQ